MYARDGVLLPTVSNEYRSSRDAIVRYFQTFLTNKPQGKIDQSEVSVGSLLGWIVIMLVLQSLMRTGSCDGGLQHSARLAHLCVTVQR